MTVKKEKRDKRKSGSPSIWELIVAAIGCLLFLFSLTFISFKAFAGNDLPPDVVVTSETIVPVENGFLVKIKTENKGGEVVSNIVIKGTLLEGDKEIETNDTEFDYIPSESIRSGGIFFVNDPSKYRLVLQAAGYQEP